MHLPYKPIKIVGSITAASFAIAHVYSQRQEGLAWSEVEWWVPLCIVAVAALFWTDIIANYLISGSDDHDQDVG